MCHLLQCGQARCGLLHRCAPLYIWRTGGKLASITGPAEKNDGAEWSVVLKGNRLHDVNEGDWLKVRVIDHPAVVVNGVLVPRWAKVRVAKLLGNSPEVARRVYAKNPGEGARRIAEATG